jgi:serine phosphatase RsbU (regulator of sigma subunit)
VPFRITHDNRPVNLIPLCKKCHKRVETILNDVVLTGIPPQLILLAFGSMLRERQLATFMKLREVVRNG